MPANDVGHIVKQAAFLNSTLLAFSLCLLIGCNDEAKSLSQHEVETSLDTMQINNEPSTTPSDPAANISTVDDGDVRVDNLEDPPFTEELPRTESRSLIPLTLNANDVTILFEPPSRHSDMSKHIRLTDFDTDRVLPQDVFDEAIAKSLGPTGTVKGTNRKIGFASTPQRQDWVISGLRVDPGAPGLSQGVFDTFGKSPQIRLIAQPIRQTGDKVDIEDISLHLVYAFHGLKDPAQCQLHNTPDMDRFTKVVEDLVAIKTRFATDHQVDTSGPLNIHPGHLARGEDFSLAIKGYLNEHLTRDTLFAVSIAGIPSRFEPWIFLALNNTPRGLQPLPGPGIVQPILNPLQANFSQMLSFIDSPKVQPAPATRNLQSTDCQMNFGFRPPGEAPKPVGVQIFGAGVSTAQVFDGAGDINSIYATIADATASHFFNTDCVSCHTETRKQIDMAGSRPEQRTMMGQIANEADIDVAVLPNGEWNVRAMGWAPVNAFDITDGAHATITRRAATETHEVLECFSSGRWHIPNESCLIDD